MLAFLFTFLFLYACAYFLGHRRVLTDRVGFLHPNAGGGGGGERVLWAAIRGLQEKDKEMGLARTYVLYTVSYGAGRRASPHAGSSSPPSKSAQDENLLDLVYDQFGIRLIAPLDIVYLRPDILSILDGNSYPYVTLLLQTVVGGFYLFLEVCVKNNPTEVMIETVGIPFVYLLFRIFFGIQSITYTHYPVISTDMLHRVSTATTTYNNRPIFARFKVLRFGKMAYYWLFSCLYRLMGQFPSIVMVNSSWTAGHLRSMWWPKKCNIVFPPCNAGALCVDALPPPPASRTNNIVSVGQFRPEKNHALQLRAFAAARARLPKDSKLLLVGGARNEEDRVRVEALKKEAESLKIFGAVEFHVSAPFSQVKELLQTSCVGLHTMLDEHFGIVILEYLASGCVPLANNSGGVRADIVTSPSIGLLASSEEEYADGMVKLVDMKMNHPEEYAAMQARGVAKARLFSDEAFAKHFCDSVYSSLPSS